MLSSNRRFFEKAITALAFIAAHMFNNAFAGGNVTSEG